MLKLDIKLRKETNTMEKIIVLDTETTNGIMAENGKLDLSNSLVYDIGFMVCDMLGNIYEKHSYTIADVFLDSELMEVAFFKDKIGNYWEDIKNGTRKLRRLSTVRHILYDVCKQYDIHKIYAYNMKFDYDALLTTTRYMTSSRSRYYMPYGLEIHDIMKLAKPLYKDENYKMWCSDNGYTTANGRPQIKAETLARYYFDKNFQESHTGLEDVELEYKILRLLSGMYQDIDTKLW